MPDIKSLFSFQSDFSQGGIERFIVAIVFSLFFGLSMGALYRVYYRTNEPLDGSIARSFPLMSPAVTTIFWLIQFSLPLSLGLLGALSFVRFRTPVKRAEDIAFILLMIAGALACAIGRFRSALALLILIGLYGYLRHRLPWLREKKHTFALLSLHSHSDIASLKVEQLLEELGTKGTLASTTSKDGLYSAVYNVQKFPVQKSFEIIANMQRISPDTKVDVYFPESQFNG